MTKAQYAFAAMFFAVVALAVLAIYGDAATRALVVYSALLISWSQFAAQTRTPLANNASIVAVYLALLIALIAASRMLLGIP